MDERRWYSSNNFGKLEENDRNFFSGDTSAEEDDEKAINFIQPLASSDSDASDNENLQNTLLPFRAKKHIFNRAIHADCKQIRLKEHQVVLPYEASKESNCDLPQATTDKSMNNTWKREFNSGLSDDEETASEVGDNCNFLVSAEESDKIEEHTKSSAKGSTINTKRASFGIKEKVRQYFQPDELRNSKQKERDNDDASKLNKLEVMTTINSNSPVNEDTRNYNTPEDGMIASSVLAGYIIRWQSKLFQKGIAKGGDSPKRINSPKNTLSKIVTASPKRIKRKHHKSKVYIPWNFESFVLFKKKPDLNALGIAEKHLSTYNAAFVPNSSSSQKTGNEAPSGWIFVPMPVFKFPRETTNLDQKGN